MHTKLLLLLFLNMAKSFNLLNVKSYEISTVKCWVVKPSLATEEHRIVIYFN